MSSAGRLSQRMPSRIKKSGQITAHDRLHELEAAHPLSGLGADRRVLPGDDPASFLVGGLFSAVLVFQIVTLPVEFDASARAKKLAFQCGIVTAEEQQGMAKVLAAAALTYVAAAISTLMTLLYYLMRTGLLGGSRD